MNIELETALRTGTANHGQQIDAADEIARLRRLAKSAYNEGFAEGMNDALTSRGGNAWGESRSCLALSANQEKPAGK